MLGYHFLVSLLLTPYHFLTNAIQALVKATRNGGVPSATLELVHLRASQINLPGSEAGCTVLWLRAVWARWLSSCHSRR